MCILMVCSSVLAQPGKSGKRTAERLADAERMMQMRMYPDAKAILERTLAEDSITAKTYVLLGNIAYVERAYSKAQGYYHRFLQKSGVTSQPEIAVRQAQLLHEAGSYDQALNLCQQLAKDSNSNVQFKWGKFTELRKAQWAVKQIQNPTSKTPELMGPPLNSLPLQYLPSMSPDEQQFFFTGRVAPTGSSDENIYVMERRGNSWSPPIGISDAVNSPYNEGACSISGDGNTMVFTVCESPNSTTGCDLYISKRQPGGDWGRPENLVVVNSRYWDSQPSLSPDGNELFFASARPGGVGKSDIWVSKTNEEGGWTTPVNLGPVVNSPEEDHAPQLHSNGKTLFFASKGHLGFGGFDLFMTERDPQGVWTVPFNLGYPLNTQHHESALFVNASGSEGYLTRETKEPATSHLWQWPVPAWITSKVSCAIMKGTVVDAVTGKPLDAELWASPPDATGQVYNVSTVGNKGKFTLVLPATKTYTVHVTSKGYLFHSFQTNSLDRKPPDRTIKLTPIKKAETLVLGNLYFPNNGDKPLPESEAELRFLARYIKNSVRTKILIEGHTDDVGKAFDNLDLSRRRAQYVVDYLKAKGIFEARLTAEGRGMSQPAVPNTSEKNRAQNRRITMTITPY